VADLLRTPSDITSSTSPPSAGTMTFPPRANDKTSPVRPSRTMIIGCAAASHLTATPPAERMTLRGSAGAARSAAGEADIAAIPTPGPASRIVSSRAASLSSSGTA
jgi:hypothetical protein